MGNVVSRGQMVGGNEPLAVSLWPLVNERYFYAVDLKFLTKQ
jgi:hypothetical protein